MSAETHELRREYLVKKERLKERLNRRFGLDKMPVIRKLVYSVIGVTVLLIGIVMIITPGPAFLVIPLGLAILASEYAWARRIIRRGSVFVGRRVRGRVPRKHRK
jgi:tellurite resistance protein TerC/cation:H+ antiporter